MKTGFGHFLDFGTSEGLDIAYHDSAKCFLAFGNGDRSCIINQLCIISIIYAKKSQKGPKNEVLGTFTEYGRLDWSDIANSDRY